MSPKAIFIDKVFAVVPDLEKEEKTAKKFLDTIKSPVYSGAIVSSLQLPARKPIDIQENTHRFQSLTAEFLAGLQNATDMHVYGPIEFLQNYFKPGHILYHNSREFVPGFQLADGGFLPHLGLQIAKTISQGPNPQHIKIDHTAIKLKNGAIPINFIHPDRFKKNKIPLDKILRANKQLLQQYIQKGDVVVILPAYYTGSGDFRYSPYGIVNGGYFVLSVINSVLTEHWLHYFNLDIIFLFLSIATACGLVFLLPPVYFFMAPLIPLFLFLFAMLLFAYNDQVSTWPVWIFAYILAFIVSIVCKRFLDLGREQNQLKLIGEAKVAVRDNLLLEAKKSTLLREKQDAARVAASLLPDPIPKNWPGIQLSAFHHCFDAASGDWYFFYHHPDTDYFHIGMLDIVGHGVQAAIIVSSCKALLAGVKKNRPEWSQSALFHEQMVFHLNEVLFAQAKGGHQTTYCGLTLKKSSRKIQLLAAGHPFPVIIDSDRGTIKRVKSANNPPGIIEGSTYESVEIELNIGQKLLIFSDGLPIMEKKQAFKKFLNQVDFTLESAKEISEGFEGYLSSKYDYKIEDDISAILVEIHSESSAGLN